MMLFNSVVWDKQWDKRLLLMNETEGMALIGSSSP